MLDIRLSLQSQVGFDLEDVIVVKNSKVMSPSISITTSRIGLFRIHQSSVEIILGRLSRIIVALEPIAKTVYFEYTSAFVGLVYI